MISYVYNNNRKSMYTIKKKIMSLFDIEVISEEVNNLILGNDKLLINVEKRKTNILLLDDDTNVSTLANYFRGKKNE